MLKTKIAKVALHIVRDLKNPNFQGFAPQIAFYFMLSLVPVLILLTQLLSLFSLNTETFGQLFDEYTSGLFRILEDMISYKPTGTMNAAFIVMALWAASKLYFFLSQLASYAMEGQRLGLGFRYVKERFRAMLIIVFTLVMVVFSLVIIVYGEMILRGILDVLFSIFAIRVDEKYLDILEVRWPLGLILYFLTISYTYCFLPSKRLRFRQVAPGSLFTSVMILVISLVFSLYVKNIADYAIIYGSMASIAAMLMWFYMLGWMLGLGIMVNKAWKEVALEEAEDPAS